MKKWLAALLCVVLLCGMLSGCSSALNPQTPVTLTLWHVYGSNTESPLNDVIRVFNSTVGTEKGIIVNVTSVTNSNAIDEMLLSSLHNEPGTIGLPDLFTAYPRIAEKFPEGQLLDWEAYFTEDDLAAYHEDFLAEGYFGEELLMIPIAKSSELLFINQTLFDRFAAENHLTADCLTDIEQLMQVCNLYYDWSGGKTMFQINDFYHYFLSNMEGLGVDFIVNGKANVDSDAFEKVFIPLAKAGIHGGLNVGDGYASSRWKTGEIIGNLGSTADILYLRDYITYDDNSTENIEIAVLPYPNVAEAASSVVLRGGGLFAVKNEDEKKNEAAAIFAKWIAEKQHNLTFVTNAGYIPVCTEAMNELFSDLSVVENERYRMLYAAIGQQQEADYTYCSVPRFNGSADLQSTFEKLIQTTLATAHAAYKSRVDAGEDPQAVMTDLLGTALASVKEELR